MTTAMDRVEPRRGGPFETIRAFGVMSGGPIALFVFVVLSARFAIADAAHGKTPRRWALAGLATFLGYVTVLRPWSQHWGTTTEERRKSLPGDDIVARPGIQTTRAVTIDAPPSEVWPWLAQIGQDRGGFYSYSWLENLAGCHLRNADRIHAEWQQRSVGDSVLLHPAAGLPLTRFDPPHSYALQGWYFALEPKPPNRTRLLARGRVPRGLSTATYAIFIELPHFVMERKMLLGIKRRAERNRSFRTSDAQSAAR